MKLLLHACCAPCTAGALEDLSADGIHPVVYWMNPNIHPYTEYAARLDALQVFLQRRGIPLVIDGKYNVSEFLTAAAGFPVRCAYCYAVRFDAAAAHAARHGFDAFSTTLSISPYQDRELIEKTGKAAGEKYGVSFVLRNFRPFFRQGHDIIRSEGLYLQKYCGCILSEAERYEKKIARQPIGFFPNFNGFPES